MIQNKTHVDTNSFGPELTEQLDGHAASRRKSAAASAADRPKHQESVRKHTAKWVTRPWDRGYAYRKLSGNRGQSAYSLDQEYRPYDPNLRGAPVPLTPEEIEAAAKEKLEYRSQQQLLATLRDVAKHGSAFGKTQTDRLRSEAFGRSREDAPNIFKADRCKRCFSAHHVWGDGACLVQNQAPPALTHPSAWCKMCDLRGDYTEDCRVCASCGRWGHLVEECGADFPYDPRRWHY